MKYYEHKCEVGKRYLTICGFLAECVSVGHSATLKIINSSFGKTSNQYDMMPPGSYYSTASHWPCNPAEHNGLGIKKEVSP